MNRILILFSQVFLAFWSGQNVIFLLESFQLRFKIDLRILTNFSLQKKNQSATFWRNNCRQKTNFNLCLKVTIQVSFWSWLLGFIDTILYLLSCIIYFYQIWFLLKRPCENTAVIILKKMLYQKIFHPIVHVCTFYKRVHKIL